MKYLLYAEDDLDDQQLLTDLLSKMEPGVKVRCFPSGLPLMQYLEALAPSEAQPCCIVLDMNMPGWNGMHTLQAIKKHPEFDQLPVIIFTTSNSRRDADLARRHGAADFITKPITQQEFKGMLRQFQRHCYPSEITG